MQVSWESVCAGAVVPSATGFWLWMQARANGKKDAVSGQAAMIKAAQDAATSVISDLRAEITSLREDAAENGNRITALEEALKAEKKARTDERHVLAGAAQVERAKAALAEKRAEEAEHRLELADGERRQLLQLIDSLTRRLRELGVDLPLPASRSTEPILLGAPQPA